MSYNFLGLVNDVSKRLNEVQLTSSNFASASGYHSSVKEAVNSAIRLINQDQFFWPFNYISKDETLVAGTIRYPFPTDAKIIDFNTFRIQRDSTLGNDTQHLRQMDYEQFLENFADYEYNTDTDIRQLPERVCRTPGQEFLLTPPPDKAYTLTYEYYSLPVDLINYDDVPTVPSAYRHIIIDGAMYYLYLFRADIESADRMFVKFEEGIGNMKSIYINRFEYVRDTRVHQGNRYYGFKDIS